MRESDEFLSFPGEENLVLIVYGTTKVCLLWKTQISKKKRIKITFNNRIFKHFGIYVLFLSLWEQMP